MTPNRIILYTLSVIIAMAGMTSCSDNDTFSLSPDRLLSFETDSLSLDTVFSTVPTPHKRFSVYNNSGDGLRITNIRMQQGNQSGFRVNVNGSFLSKENGYQINDMELRSGDSLRVFVEMTSVENGDSVPHLVEDNLIFNLESGSRQVVNLNAYSWDATLMRDVTIRQDTMLANVNGKPIVVYGTLTVDSLCTLTVAPATTIYFHDGAGIDVIGTLHLDGEADREITLRCDRMDRMVSNLTYDNNPGQWRGIRLRGGSFGNSMTFTDLHGATTAFACDSSLDASRRKLTIANSTIHNLKGFGVKAKMAEVSIENSQISNAFAGCLHFVGGNITMNHCTVPQYYPFDALRGPAVYFTNAMGDVYCPLTMDVRNSLITGYADDVISWSYGTLDSVMNVRFDHCQLRTDFHGWTLSEAEVKRDSLLFDGSWFEDVKDTLSYGRNSFKLFDTHFFFYDFTPVGESKCIGTADPATALPADRRNQARDMERPDVGCFVAEKKPIVQENESH